MRLSELPSGRGVFVDANIFLYHFQGASSDCRRFLERCERGEFRSVGSTETLIEIAHRTLLAEAIRLGMGTPKTVLRRLKEKPELIRALRSCSDLLDRARGVLREILPVSPELFDRSVRLALEHGLLIRDALVAATLEAAGLQDLATADRDFVRVPGLRVWLPGDL
jgi:predicted nucleic acid-binding protein